MTTSMNLRRTRAAGSRRRDNNASCIGLTWSTVCQASLRRVKTRTVKHVVVSTSVGLNNLTRATWASYWQRAATQHALVVCGQCAVVSLLAVFRTPQAWAAALPQQGDTSVIQYDRIVCARRRVAPCPCVRSTISYMGSRQPGGGVPPTTSGRAASCLVARACTGRSPPLQAAPPP
eukprot:CAMPEP_0185201956 /NCGR_PEP_ID=MMETSP1140-20130426/50207_1 /TAXON_ID=298111 /ORGANISM="Pavlova sp., Strain CCMP459" /LENGTH=175 /DNA_ID=CAMNT_0027769369 /DNA_START=108 /DNA_END=633 /DNA_ORIENTATION=-